MVIESHPTFVCHVPFVPGTASPPPRSRPGPELQFASRANGESHGTVGKTMVFYTRNNEEKTWKNMVKDKKKNNDGVKIETQLKI